MATSTTSMTIQANLASVRQRMRQAAERAGRDLDDVLLVAVTKGRSVDEIRAAHAAGLTVFGENRVEEGRDKIEQLAGLDGVSWHMIGQIQSRKARDVVGAFSLVHSVDRPKIAEKLNELAGQVGVRQPVLIECNVSGEGSKGGWPMHVEASWEGWLPAFQRLVGLDNIEVQGLMTMAPWTKDRGLLGEVFGRLRSLSRFLTEKIPGNYWGELSMGMTDDFEVAIEHGATMIRLGRAIFDAGGYDSQV